MKKRYHAARGRLPEAPHPENEKPEAALPTPSGRWNPRLRRFTFSIILLLVFFISPFFLKLSSSQSLAQTLLKDLFKKPEPQLIKATEVNAPAPKKETKQEIKFSNRLDHPDRLFLPYFGDAQRLPSSDDPRYRLIKPFHELLDLFTKRQGVDDNFTIRVYDNRDGSVLELYTLEEEKQKYEATGHAVWEDIDKLRREQTRRLVNKYEQLGHPKETISAKWGRRNQVLEARLRETPLIEYEMRLARYLGLSLLATEIGTVETFNQDWMVSSVGARSRYQMMPYILRKSGIHSYRLQTSYGKRVDVHEEQHPLLTMEPALRLLRGYVNAVGHEVPGLSAYHTGPGNIFKIYQIFLDKAPELCTANTTVLDAYVWAETEGFDEVSSQTSFRQTSQGYVPSNYGSLRAVEDLPIDTTLTLRAEQVQLKPGQSILLSDLLTALEKSDVHLRWARGTSSLSLYERFRILNPHFDLAPGTADGGVPSEGNVRLVDQVGDATVRFFLPLNASKVLADEGVDVIDQDAVFRYDHDTFSPPDAENRTQWDDAYNKLVYEIGRFGFSEEHLQRLNRLAAVFDSLATENPSHYRLSQLAIIKTHQNLWQFKGWDDLAAATEKVRGIIHLQNLAPRPIDPNHPLERMTPRPPASSE